MTYVKWTEEFEQELLAKLKEEYQQADDAVVFASRAGKPFKKGGLIKVKESAVELARWIKKELDLCYINYVKESTDADLEKEIDEFMKVNIVGNSTPGVSRPAIEEWGKRVARHFAARQRELMLKNAKAGVVKADYQIAMDDGLWIDLDPCMQLTPVLDVKPGDRVKVIAIKEE